MTSAGGCFVRPGELNTVLMASRRSEPLIGLGKYAWIPNSRQRAASPRTPAEVSMTTIVLANCGSRLICSTTWKPSTSGIWESSSTREKGAFVLGGSS